MGEEMKNVRNTVATAAATTVLVGLCAFLTAGTAVAAPAGDRLAAPAAGAVDRTDDESWH
ncbi:hypothetical protein GCM10010327_35050 [Streptomyces nitrosporeus]|nr:hypothetical protein GCM10010327_35050 [Streptomyces nitrosporeus]